MKRASKPSANQITMSKRTQSNFVEALLTWFQGQKRAFPWRETRDPYRIWISEVMLQQTQAATVVPYYVRFLEKFPDIAALAAASDSALMKAWEGLGYYARARNLRRAARIIVDEHQGKLPGTQAELLKLPGFGLYTSASVASLAFGADCAAVDGNVMRVLARVYAIAADIKQSTTRRDVQRLADALIPQGRAGTFNEALMELGATVCKPKAPRCTVCPVRRYCRAYREHRVDQLPVTSKKPAIPHHQIAIGVVHRDGRVLIALRPAEGLLGNLWEFPGGKRKPSETLKRCCQRELEEETGLAVNVGKRFAVVQHAYSHFRITLHAYHCTSLSGEAAPKTSQEIRWVSLDELDDYAFPKANKRIIEALRQAF
jgi:A/G-specific adenine glycosylase